MSTTKLLIGAGVAVVAAVGIYELINAISNMLNPGQQKGAATAFVQKNVTLPLGNAVSNIPVLGGVYNAGYASVAQPKIEQLISPTGASSEYSNAGYTYTTAPVSQVTSAMYQQQLNGGGPTTPQIIIDTATGQWGTYNPISDATLQKDIQDASSYTGPDASRHDGSVDYPWSYTSWAGPGFYQAGQIVAYLGTYGAYETWLNDPSIKMVTAGD